jgi:hypothetical protein
MTGKTTLLHQQDEVTIEIDPDGGFTLGQYNPQTGETDVIGVNSRVMAVMFAKSLVWALEIGSEEFNRPQPSKSVEG